MRLLVAAARDLRRTKLRNALSAGTMFVGVLALVAVSAASSISNDMLLAYEERQNGRAVTWSAYVPIDTEMVATLVPEVHRRLVDAIGPQDAAVVLSAQIGMLVTTERDHSLNRSAGTLDVEWEAGDLTAVRRLAVVDGADAFAGFGGTELPPRLMVNEAAARVVGGAGEQPLLLATSPDGGHVRFVVAGVVADGGDTPRAYGSLSTFLALFPLHTVSSVQVRLRTGTADQRTVDHLLADVLADAGITDRVDVTRADTTWRVTDQVATLRAVFTGFAALMLVIAATGLLNVGLSTVRERARELVVRRALGARRRDVFALVLGSSVLTALVVALIATATAALVMRMLIPQLVPQSSAIETPGFPWTACLVGCAAAVATAIAGAAVPAWRAARIPVALALRE